uniref:STI1/HOP DP domain-containing protein n=2 Tax=Lotharella globosa TaxID=91324 RepID=A0A7S3Z048_9EUKA
MMDPAMQAKLRQLQQAFSNPQLIKDFQALTANDPRFAAMNEDMRLNGPQSMMKYMSDPEIMGKFSQIMQKYAPADLMQQSKAAQEAIKNGQIGFGGPNPTGAPEESPLIKAVLKGDVAEVEALCKSGKTNVNDKDPAGYTPILYAVMKKHTPVIKALIASGADVKAKGARGWGALHYAAGTTNDEAMELLLDNGADINERTDDGYLAFDIALKSPKHNPGSSSKIIQRLVPQDTITELHQAGRWCSLTKTKELLDQGKDLAQGDKAGMNAVHWAARQSDTPVFNALKENPQFTEKKLMESRDQFMNTPLHYAAGYNSKEIVLALLAMGADVNARNKNGHRPFTLASRDANAGILKDPVVGREMGIKLFGMAEPLKGVNPVSALTASQVNDTEAFKVAADKDNMVETDEEKRTAAHWAASFGNAEIMSKLIQENPAVLNMTDADGNTPLHVSCFKGNKLVTQLLCSSGAPRFSRNKDGQVPYDLARLRPKEDGDKEDILKCLAGMKI